MQTVRICPRPRPARRPNAPHRVRRLRKFLLVAFALLAAPAAWASPVESGDTLSISVAETPSLTRTAKIDADGRIMLPMIGSMKVAGLELDAIRDAIRQRLMQGELVLNPTVLVEVSAYRPFYVGGAVNHPGAFPYEPGMSVRQGIVLAGGLERGQRALAPTGEEAIRILADARTTSFDLLRINGQIARLNAVLDKTPRIDVSNIDQRLVSPKDAAQIISLEKGILEDTLARSAADTAHSDRLLGLVSTELDLLGKQAAIQKDEQKAENQNIEVTRNLHAKGLVPLDRLKEVERQARLLSGDMLNTEAQTARANQTAETVTYTLASTRVERRITLQNQLGDALQQRTELSAKLEALSSRLLAAGIAAPGSGNEPPAPKITIYRRDAAAATQTITAGMDQEIRPGDVLDVEFAAPPQP